MSKVSKNLDDNEVGRNAEDYFAEFGEDYDNWKWVVGLSNGPGKLRFVRVPNRSSRTLTAVIAKHVAPGSVVHSDG